MSIVKPDKRLFVIGGGPHLEKYQKMAGSNITVMGYQPFAVLKEKMQHAKAFIFAADLLREVTIPSEISFVKLASYQGTTSTGKVREVIGLNEDLSGRTVVIVEDIVDTGRTMKQMVESLGTRNPESVHICTLFFKPSKLQEDVNPDDFIVGYGLDYDQQGRGLKDVYTIVD